MSVAKQEAEEHKIPIRHIQPLTMEIDATRVTDPSEVVSGDVDKCHAELSDHLTVLKVMTS
jgi:hypothetical protein